MQNSGNKLSFVKGEGNENAVSLIGNRQRIGDQKSHPWFPKVANEAGENDFFSNLLNPEVQYSELQVVGQFENLSA